MTHQNLLPTLLRGATLAKEAQEARETAIAYLRKETVARMKAEVLSDIRDKMVNEDVKSFSELHDSVDANEYGGFCEDILSEAYCAFFGGRDEHEGMPDAYIDFLNECQGEIDEWLKNGGAHGDHDGFSPDESSFG